jgi:hypothetical protein
VGAVDICPLGLVDHATKVVNAFADTDALADAGRTGD